LRTYIEGWYHRQQTILSLYKYNIFKDENLWFGWCTVRLLVWQYINQKNKCYDFDNKSEDTLGPYNWVNRPIKGRWTCAILVVIFMMGTYVLPETLILHTEVASTVVTRPSEKNKVGQRTQKQDGTQHAFSWKSWGVASCALHEIDVRSLLKHRAHWWYQGPRFTTACCVSYAYSLLIAISVNVINSIPSV